MTVRRAAAFAVASCLWAAGLFAASPDDKIPPAPKRYLTDNAGALPPGRADA